MPQRLLLEVDDLKKVEARSWSLRRMLEISLLCPDFSRFAYLLEGRWYGGGGGIIVSCVLGICIWVGDLDESRVWVGGWDGYLFFGFLGGQLM